MQAFDVSRIIFEVIFVSEQGLWFEIVFVGEQGSSLGFIFESGGKVTP